MSSPRTPRLRRLLPLTVGLLAIAFAVPALAGATIFKGTFDHHDKKMRLIVGKSKEPKKLVFRNWRADCEEPGARARETTRFFQPFDRSSKNIVVDRGGQVDNDHGYRLKYHVAMTGHRRSASRWSGSFKLSIDVFNRGEQIDTCKTGRLHWVARK